MTIEEQQALVARARRARAEAVLALAGAALRALWARARRIHHAWRLARTRLELHALSDRALKDIGLRRSDIDALVR